MQFSVGLHKCATYPPQHPVVVSAGESAFLQLIALLSERESLALGVGRNQLIIEGAATDTSSAVLTELAGRLHRHQIGAIRFQNGVDQQEVTDLLATLSLEANLEEIPFGLRPADELDRWRHIKVVPLTFDQMRIDDEGSDEEHDSLEARLWLGLAAAALAQEEGDASTPTDPTAVAKAIDKHKGDKSYDQVIVGYLQQLGRELKVQDGTSAKLLSARVNKLLGELEEGTLTRLMETGGSLATRTQLLADFSQTLPVDAVLDLVTAAAEANHQTISQSLLRMLSKLADHSTSGGIVQPQADANFRKSVNSLLDNWTLADPNPDAYTDLLERLSTAGAETPTELDHQESEAPRIIQMCLEIDVWGSASESALDTILQTGRFQELLEILDGAPESSDATLRAWHSLASPLRVALLLESDALNVDDVQRVLERLGVEAAGPLIDALATTESRAMRHRLLQTLTAMGPSVAGVAVERMKDAEWYVQRNLLVLLGSLGVWPEDFSPEPYARHADSRVRREAIKVMLQADDADLVAAGIQHGMADDDHSAVRMALTAAIASCPPAAERLVLQRAYGEDEDFRVLAIRVMSGIRKPHARKVLAEFSLAKRKWWQRRRRLAGPSPEMLAAVSALAETWAGTPEVEYILDLARASPHTEVRAVVNDT